jgi:hypothetical protein
MPRPELPSVGQAAHDSSQPIRQASAQPWQVHQDRSVGLADDSWDEICYDDHRQPDVDTRIAILVNCSAAHGSSDREGGKTMDLLVSGGEWLMALLINLLVPALVWITVIAGLILIVREKVEEEDLQIFTSPPHTNDTRYTCGPINCSIDFKQRIEERS